MTAKWQRVGRCVKMMAAKGTQPRDEDSDSLHEFETHYCQHDKLIALILEKVQKDHQLLPWTTVKWQRVGRCVKMMVAKGTQPRDEDSASFTMKPIIVCMSS